MTQQQPPPWKQLRPSPVADPGFRLDPNGTARFEYSGHMVDVHVRYTTEEDEQEHGRMGDDTDVLVFASVDIAGVTVGRSNFPAEWGNPYSLRDALAYVLREAVDSAERKVNEMADELSRIQEGQR